MMRVAFFQAILVVLSSRVATAVGHYAASIATAHDATPTTGMSTTIQSNPSLRVESRQPNQILRRESTGTRLAAEHGEILVANIESNMMRLDSIHRAWEEILNASAGHGDTNRMLKLESLWATKYPTDKLYGHHYQRAYVPFTRDLPVKRVLEVGLGAKSCMGSDYTPGNSLRAWRDYFGAQVVGLDIDKNALFSEESITTHLVTSNNNKSATEFRELLNGVTFEFILDDGDHSESSQAATLQNLWPVLANNGLYAIEDLGVSLLKHSSMTASHAYEVERLELAREKMLKHPSLFVTTSALGPGNSGILFISKAAQVDGDVALLSHFLPDVSMVPPLPSTSAAAVEAWLESVVRDRGNAQSGTTLAAPLPHCFSFAELQTIGAGWLDHLQSGKHFYVSYARAPNIGGSKERCFMLAMKTDIPAVKPVAWLERADATDGYHTACSQTT